MVKTKKKKKKEKKKKKKEPVAMIATESSLHQSKFSARFNLAPLNHSGTWAGSFDSSTTYFFQKENQNIEV